MAMTLRASPPGWALGRRVAYRLGNASALPQGIHPMVSDLGPFPGPRSLLRRKKSQPQDSARPWRARRPPSRITRLPEESTHERHAPAQQAASRSVPDAAFLILPHPLLAVIIAPFGLAASALGVTTVTNSPPVLSQHFWKSPHQGGLIFDLT